MKKIMEEYVYVILKNGNEIYRSFPYESQENCIFEGRKDAMERNNNGEIS